MSASLNVALKIKPLCHLSAAVAILDWPAWRPVVFEIRNFKPYHVPGASPETGITGIKANFVINKLNI